MLQLAILACMVMVPSDCIEARLTAPANVTPYQCLQQAMPQIAKWYESNPTRSRGRYVKKWRCVRPGRVAFPEAARDV